MTRSESTTKERASASPEDIATLRAVHEFLTGSGLDCMWPGQSLSEADALRLESARLLASVSAHPHADYCEDDEDADERIGYHLTIDGLAAIGEGACS